MTDSAPPWRELLAQEERALGQLVDRLASIRTVIAGTEAALQRSRRDKFVLEAIIARKRLVSDAQRSLLCPIAKLSDETLAAIFHFLDDKGESDSAYVGSYMPPHSSMSVPFTLAGVCRRWRTRALHCPILWRRICFHCNTATVEKLELMIQRSQSSPLTIHVSGYLPGPIHDALLHRLLSQSARWRFISITFLGSGNGDDYILNNFRVATPLLEGLGLFSDDNCPELDEACSHAGDMISFLPYAPRLRILKLELCMLRRAALCSAPLLEWLEFANDCEQMDPERMLDVLSIAPSLEELQISRAACDFSPCRRRPLVTLPLLLSLTCDAELLLGIMDYLHLPALRTLTLNDYECLPGHERIFQCYPNIETLALFYDPHASPTRRAPPGQLPFLVSHLPQLCNLRLSRFAFDGDDFARLSRPDPVTGTWLAPHLCVLRLGLPKFVPGTYGPPRLLEFVRSRSEGYDGVNHGCARMRWVTIGGCSERSRWVEDLAMRMCSPA